MSTNQEITPEAYLEKVNRILELEKEFREINEVLNDRDLNMQPRPSNEMKAAIYNKLQELTIMREQHTSLPYWDAPPPPPRNWRYMDGGKTRRGKARTTRKGRKHY